MLASAGGGVAATWNCVASGMVLFAGEDNEPLNQR